VAGLSLKFVRQLVKTNIFVIFLFSTALFARVEWYDIDYTKSQITFLGKSRVSSANGIFRKWNFSGKITSSFHVSGDILIDCASIDTDNERRDKHLKSSDFFDCEKFPQHTFRIRSVTPNDKSAKTATQFIVVGALTMHGVTQNVELTLQRDENGNSITLSGSVMLNREDFGITYNSLLNPIEKNIRVRVVLNIKLRTNKTPYGP